MIGALLSLETGSGCNTGAAGAAGAGGAGLLLWRRIGTAACTGAAGTVFTSTCFGGKSGITGKPGGDGLSMIRTGPGSRGNPAGVADPSTTGSGFGVGNDPLSIAGGFGAGGSTTSRTSTMGAGAGSLSGRVTT